MKATEGERDELRARAAELGVSVPRLMVEAALDGGSLTATERRQEMVELFEVRRLLSTVANNINQLARLANTSREVPVGERLERTLADVDGLVARLRELTGVRR